MSDLQKVYFTEDAGAEIRALPGDRKAWIEAKVRHVTAVGWAESLRLKLVKDLKDKYGTHEIRIKGKGASYRLLCYPLSGLAGRIVVTTTCSGKGSLMGRRLKQECRQAKNRLDKWVSNNEELLR